VWRNIGLLCLEDAASRGSNREKAPIRAESIVSDSVPEPG
jgi:hypothetical protein